MWVPFSVSQTSSQNTGQSAASPPLTCLTPSSEPLPHTSATAVMNSPVAPVLIPSTSKPLSNQMSFSSCSSPAQFSGLLTTPTAHTVPRPPPLTVKKLCHLRGQMLRPSASLAVSWGPAVPPMLLKQPVLNCSAAHPQGPPPTVLWTSSPDVCQVFPILLSQEAPSTVRQPETNLQILPALAPSQTSTCPSSASKPLPQTGVTSDANSPVVDLSSQTSITPPTSTGGPLTQTDGATDTHLSVPQQTLDQHLVSSPLQVVRAVADSACDHSVQQVKARQQEPTENEPTSTVSEETEPAGKVGHLDLSRWQPRVTLFRLPVTPPCHGSEESEVGHHLWTLRAYIRSTCPVLCTQIVLFSVSSLK